ncbi:hypothetical protein PM082_004461 [Marasmius tenuissimus]|nr:hypothetical protein PM082_004461 [Marasmius tenuissimus]
MKCGEERLIANSLDSVGHKESKIQSWTPVETSSCLLQMDSQDRLDVNRYQICAAAPECPPDVIQGGYVGYYLQWITVSPEPFIHQPYPKQVKAIQNFVGATRESWELVRSGYNYANMPTSPRPQVLPWTGKRVASNHCQFTSNHTKYVVQLARMAMLKEIQNSV